MLAIEVTSVVTVCYILYFDLISDEEEEFRKLAASPDVYEKIAKSIAPSIFGSQDIKKSISCLLFGGSRKR